MTIRPENAHRGVDAPEAGERPRRRARADDAGSREVARRPSTTSTAAPSRLELVDQPVLRVADDEVVAPRGEQPRQRRPDVEAGVGDERHPSRCVGHGVPSRSERPAAALPEPHPTNDSSTVN